MRVSEWESGAPLSPEKAADLWERYDARLRRWCRFQDLTLRRAATEAASDGAGAAA